MTIDGTRKAEARRPATSRGNLPRRSTDHTPPVVGSLLSFKDAAAYVGQSERWLRRAVANRTIRHFKIGAHLAFDSADLDELIQRGLREEARR